MKKIPRVIQAGIGVQMMGGVELWNMKTMLRKIVIRKNVEKVHLDDNVDERCAGDDDGIEEMWFRANSNKV